ncbi:hypothetical protein ACS0PU_000488 [Formica fusca]
MMRSQQWRPAVGDERREERWSISSAVTQRPDWLVRIMYTPTRMRISMSGLFEISPYISTKNKGPRKEERSR